MTRRMRDRMPSGTMPPARPRPALARWFLAGILTAGPTLAPAAPEGAGPPLHAVETPDAAPIGDATQDPDGTLVLTLRAEGEGGLVGDALIRYAPGDPDYAEVARHVGLIPRGGSVAVKPFARR